MVYWKAMVSQHLYDEEPIRNNAGGRYFASCSQQSPDLMPEQDSTLAQCIQEQVLSLQQLPGPDLGRRATDPSGIRKVLAVEDLGHCRRLAICIEINP